MSTVTATSTKPNGHVNGNALEVKPVPIKPPTPSETNGVAQLDASKLTIEKAERLKPVPDLGSLTFGDAFTDHMLVTTFDPKTGWSNPKIEPYHTLQLDPSCSCFQYCPNLFEGMKAYLGTDGVPRLFRPELNMQRMKASAERVALPTFDPEALLALLKKLVALEKRWIPNAPGYSLYLRPTMIGTRPSLGVHPSDHAMIYCIASPMGSYFKAVGRVSLYAVHDTVRAWPGGTGGHKLGLNYAPVFAAQRAAAARGFTQVLFLFGEDHCVTEAGAMNFFVVFKRPQAQDDDDGVEHLDLVTAPLDGTILPGVTRTSVIELAVAHSKETTLPGLSPSVRLHVEERPLSMGEIRERAARGELVEAFCCGTAVVVAPVDKIRYKDEDIVLPEAAPVGTALRERIEAIQFGEFEWEGWSVKCE